MTRLVVRQMWRGGLAVLALSVLMPAAVAATFAQVVADAGTLRAIASNAAVRTLFGPPVSLDRAGGFTVWRVGTFIAVLVGAWAILVTTRITRGAEEAGRWDPLLAGRVGLGGLTARHLVAPALVALGSGVGVAVALLVFAGPSAGAVVHGSGIAAAGLFAVALAGLTAQLFPSRAAASGAAVLVLAGGLLLRMIGDGFARLSWVRWLSPFGLLEISSPYGRDRVAPLLVLLLAAAVAFVAALVVAARRDVGSGLFAGAGGRRPRGLLRSVEAFAVRRLLVPLIAWGAGVLAYFLLVGSTAVAITSLVAGNPTVGEMAGQAGFGRLDRVSGLAAVLFALLALPVGGFAAVRVAALVSAERDGRLTLLLARPLGRSRPLLAETLATGLGMVVLVVIAALAAWAGVNAAGGGLPLTSALLGAGNALPVALLGLGAAVLAAGCAPRLVIAIGVLPTIGGFLLYVLAPPWLRGMSPFAHLAPVPLTGVDWPASAAMLAVALGLVVLGAIGYRRRDVLA